MRPSKRGRLDAAFKTRGIGVPRAQVRSRSGEGPARAASSWWSAGAPSLRGPEQSWTGTDRGEQRRLRNLCARGLALLVASLLELLVLHISCCSLRSLLEALPVLSEFQFVGSREQVHGSVHGAARDPPVHQANVGVDVLEDEDPAEERLARGGSDSLFTLGLSLTRNARRSLNAGKHETRLGRLLSSILLFSLAWTTDCAATSTWKSYLVLHDIS